MSDGAIIIDHGTSFVRAGFSDYNRPTISIPSIVSYMPCRENPGPSHARRTLKIGIDNIFPDCYSYPIQRGKVVNWEAVMFIWKTVLDTFRRRNSTLPVVITQFPIMEPEDYTKMMEIMFEGLDVPSLLLVNQLEMSLYSSGCLTGVVVDSGHGLTKVQCINTGKPIQHSRQLLHLAGQDLRDFLFQSIFKEESNQHNLGQIDLVNYTQLFKCQVPRDFQNELNSLQNVTINMRDVKSFHLPDGQSVTLTPMQQLAPTMFFNPELFEKSQPSITEAIQESINMCEANLKPRITSQMVVCGGNTLCKGFINRLLDELLLKDVYRKDRPFEIDHKSNCSVWVGASLVSELSTYSSRVLTRRDYDEY